MTLYYRNDILYCDETVPDISKNGLNWLVSLMDKQDFSTESFIKTIFQMSSITSPKVKFDENNNPIVLKDRNGNTYRNIEISNTNLNKFFYCPLIGKAGNLTFHSISNMLISSLIDVGFSKIPLSLKTHANKDDTSPHAGNVKASIDMITHDFTHSKGIVSYLNVYNLDDLKKLYESINHNSNTFEYRMFSVLIWYFYFELSIYVRKNYQYDFNNESALNEILKVNFVAIDGYDIKYVVSYLFKSLDLPDKLLSLKDEFDNLDDYVNYQESIDILKKLLNYYTNKTVIYNST